MTKYNFKNVVWQEGNNYVAQCLNIDISSFGKTKTEALANLNEALELYLEDSKKTDFNHIEKAELVQSSLIHA